MANEQNLKPFVPGYDPRRNMKGGGVSITGILNKILDGKITIEDAEEKLHKVTKREAMCINMVADALDKEEDPAVRHRATFWITERVEGKAVQPLNLSGPEDGPIQFENVPLEDRLQFLALVDKMNGQTEDEQSPA